MSGMIKILPIYLEKLLKEVQVWGSLPMGAHASLTKMKLNQW
jgi:hypothetical protein